jgi:hypothetical protein
MNQRSKRARDRKRAGQDVGAAVMSTGGHVVSHRRDAEPVVRTPAKTTGDVSGEKVGGVAKASPFFRKLGEVVNPKSKTEEKRAIAEATEKDKKEKESDQEDAK